MLITWAVLLLTQLGLLYLSQPVGLADNGDGIRTLCSISYSVYPPGAGPFIFGRWVLPEAQRVSPPTCDMDLPVSWQYEVFDVAQVTTTSASEGPLKLGAVTVFNAALTAGALTAIVALLRRGRRRSLISVVLLSIFVFDIAFLAYARSWYTEPAGFVSMLVGTASVVWLAQAGRREIPWGGVALASIAIVGLTLAKAQGVAMALALVVLVVVRLWPHRRVLLSVSGMVAVVVVYLGTAWFVLSSQPEWMDNANRYHSVFRGVTVYSDYSTVALSDLGMQPGLAKYSGKGWWDPGAGHEDPAFWEDYDKTALSNVVRYYLVHPRFAARAIGAGVSASFEMRPDYLGNFDVGSGEPARATTCRLCLFSAGAHRLQAISGLIVIGLHADALIAAIRRRSLPVVSAPFSDAPLTVEWVALAWYDLAVIPASIADGNFEIVKHTVFASFALGIAVWGLLIRLIGYRAWAGQSSHP